MDLVAVLGIEAGGMDPISSQTQRTKLNLSGFRRILLITGKRRLVHVRCSSLNGYAVAGFFVRGYSLQRGVGANDCERRYKGTAQSTAIDRMTGTRKFSFWGVGGLRLLSLILGSARGV